MAEEEGFGEFLTLGDARPRDDALRFTAGATMLLNLPQATYQCVPAKLFEYVRFDSWLLVLAEPQSATAQLFRGTTADVVAPNDVDGMADVIERRYLEFISGRRPEAIGRDGRFDRRRQAAILADHLSKILVDESRAQTSRGGGDRRERRGTSDALHPSLAGVGARVSQHRSERRNGRWRLEPPPSSARVRASPRHDWPDARRRSARIHLRSVPARDRGSRSRSTTRTPARSAPACASSSGAACPPRSSSRRVC